MNDLNNYRYIIRRRQLGSVLEDMLIINSKLEQELHRNQ